MHLKISIYKRSGPWFPCCHHIEAIGWGHSEERNRCGWEFGWLHIFHLHHVFLMLEKEAGLHGQSWEKEDHCVCGFEETSLVFPVRAGFQFLDNKAKTTVKFYFWFNRISGLCLKIVLGFGPIFWCILQDNLSPALVFY